MPSIISRKDFEVAPTFITGQIFTNESGYYPGISIMTASQVSKFISSGDFGTKAACSLNEIFCPFTLESTNASGMPIAPSGTNVGFGYIPTSNGELAQDLRFEQYAYPSGARSIGIRSDIMFVGPDTSTSASGTPTSSNASGYMHNTENWKAGELEMYWSQSKGMWTALDIVTGNLSSDIAGVGNFTITGNTIGGITMPSSVTCYNFDTGLIRSAASQVAVVAIKIGTKYIPVYVGC